MIITRMAWFVTTAFTAMSALGVAGVSTVAAQASGGRGDSTSVARLVAEPASITMKAGQTIPFKVTAYDARGNVIPNAAVRLAGPRMALSFGDGDVKAFQAGTFTAVATSVAAPGSPPVTLNIPVKVTWPALTRLTIAAEPGRLYTGSPPAPTVQGFHASPGGRGGVGGAGGMRS